MSQSPSSSVQLGRWKDVKKKMIMEKTLSTLGEESWIPSVAGENTSSESGEEDEQALPPRDDAIAYR
ncbi:hypothetical protein NQZ68_034916 [Dissostichus eleginoides]|nr:hypothetical protein NQZ68_034916 [Dissostichus eleginoides]